MSKAWRNPRQVTVHQAPTEPEDAQRIERLIALLATGMERLMAQYERKLPEPVDFHADVSHVCVREKTEDRTSL